jgi:membrane protease YdiL (CAAX protease family)
LPHRSTRALPTVSLDRRRLVAIALPVVVPVAMRATFAVGRDRLGDRFGYVAGFATYWAACAALAIGLVGPERVKELFAETHPRLGRPAILGAILLAWPPAGAIATRFVPELRQATPAELAATGGIALANASLEEVLWRGVYVSLWPQNPWLGWIWPAVGFGAWHLAPQVVHPSAMGASRYVAAATALGLSWGWVAYRTGTIRWTGLSHLMTDGSGLRNSRSFIGG